MGQGLDLNVPCHLAVVLLAGDKKSPEQMGSRWRDLSLLVCPLKELLRC